MKLTADCDLMIRLAVTAQINGTESELDPNKIQMCVAGHLYRVNYNMWPIPPNAVNINGLQNPNLATNGG
jgi:hypothetical protein